MYEKLVYTMMFHLQTIYTILNLQYVVISGMLKSENLFSVKLLFYICQTFTYNPSVNKKSGLLITVFQIIDK